MDDDSFGPRLSGHFDFTLLFEHGFFRILPSCAVLISVPIYAWKIAKSPRLVNSGLLLWAKMVVAVAIAAIQLTSVVLWCQSPQSTRAAQAASVLTFLASLATAFLTYTSHVYFFQTVAFLIVYLSGTLLFDLVTVYTYFNRASLGTLAGITCALPALRLALILLEEVSKRSLIISDDTRKTINSEQLAGFYSRSTLAWVNPLMLFGFNKRIVDATLPDIGAQFGSEELFHSFQRSWQKRNHQSRYALLITCFFAMPWPFVYILVPRLMNLGFIISQPFLLQAVVHAVSGTYSLGDNVPVHEQQTGLILATALVFVGKAITGNWFQHINNQMLTSVRGMLMMAIFDKSLKLNAVESDDGAAMTHMTADISGIEQLISLSYDTCAMVLQTLSGIAILAIFVGPACIFVVVIAAVMTIIGRFIAVKVGKTRKNWNEEVQKRLGVTSNILSQIKDIKMLGLAPSMAAFLKDMRRKEIKVAMVNRRIISGSFGFTVTAETLTPAVVVGAALFWTKAGQHISAAEFYTIIALVAMASEPFVMFLISLPNWAVGLACLGRIQEYLVQPEVQDPRQITAPVAPGPNNNLPAHVWSEEPTGAAAPSFAAKLEEVEVPKDADEYILAKASIVVQAGKVTMLHGTVGCGKSTTLRALLGEVLFKSGVAAATTSSFAYAAQKPWFLDTTIFLNIVGFKEFDEGRYKRVLFICDLQYDLDQLPRGDQTMVGSGGCHLSGGQQQRIALARTLYFDADVTVLDDPFTGLDQATSTTIRRRLLTEGYATTGGKTLVMATSMQSHLVDADYVYRVTNGGKLVYETPEEVATNLKALAGDNDTAKDSALQATDEMSEKDEPPKVEVVSDDEDYEVEKAKVMNTADLSLYRYYLRPAGLIRTLVWLFTITLTAVAERMPIIMAKIWLSHGLDNHYYYIGYAFVCISYPCLMSLSTLTFHYFVGSRISRGLHANLTEATFGASYQYLSNVPAGTLLNRHSQDVTMATQRLPIAVLPTVFRSVTVIIEIGLIGSGASYASPFLPLFLVFVLILQQYYLRTSRQLRVMELDVTKKLMQHVTEALTGVEHIRVFKWQENMNDEFRKTLEVAQKPFYFLLCIQRWLECVLEFASATAAVILVVFALKFPSSASANSVGLAFLSVMSFSDVVSEWIKQSVQMETAFGAVGRIRDFCTNTPQEEYTDTGVAVAPNWPTKGGLEVSDMSAMYRTSEKTPHRPISSLSVVMSPGECTNIVGRTGSGKTTIMLAILNLLDYTGNITIDGREIRTIPPELLRSRITTLTQGSLHLIGSVRYNLFPYLPSSLPSDFLLTESMQTDVLRRVGLLDIINQRGDLDSPMKDMRFSHGQKQLFNIARALLHHKATGSRVILMDEPTASLDEETEQKINGIFENDFKGCTVITITHRTSGTKAVDRVISLQEGAAQVQESGGRGTADGDFARE